MNDFLTILRNGPLLADGAMGSFLFERTGRLSEMNHVYEFFNLERPDLIQELHLAYLAAGARCLKTNTFGANRHLLQPFGLDKQTAAINRAGIQIARDAIARFAATEPIFILASVGPCDADNTDVYREQIESLLAAKPDALLLETFRSLPQLERLLDFIQTFPNLPPIIAELTNPADPAAFIARMQARHVPVCGVNCCAPWDADAFINAVKDTSAVRDGSVLLAAMPNGGGFQRIGNRFMSYVNPEYVGRLARSFLDRGVRLIGGCCEMHPPHIREMHNYFRSRQTGAGEVVVTSIAARPPADKAEKRNNGRFSRKLVDGEFVVSVEILPSRGTDAKVVQSKVDLIQKLAETGLADAVDITDGSRGIPLMPPGDFIHVVRNRCRWAEDALEFIPHFTARDLNLMGIQSRLIGYHANRIHNVLFITGDPPKMSPTYPRSTAVFDLDSAAMLRLAHTGLNAGVDFGGAPLGKQADPRTHFTLGAGYEPETLNTAHELEKLRKKLDHGADYIMTQPAFRHEPLRVLNPFRKRCSFLIGVMVLANLDHARRIAEVPGVVLPDEILQRLGKFSNVADQAKAAQEIAIEQIRWIKREGWNGLYLMSPASAAGIVKVMEASLR